MPRQKKDAKVLNIKLDKTVCDKLEAFCDETGVNKTMAVERFLSSGLDEYFNKSELERKLY